MAIDWNNLYGTTGPITRHTYRENEGTANYWTDASGTRYDENPFASFAGTGYVPLTSLASSPERLQGMLQAGTFTEGALKQDPTWGYMVDQSQLKDIDAGFSLKDAAMVFAPLAMTLGPYMLAGSALGGAGAGGAATGLSESAIADIVAAEGGFSALPSSGMAGTGITGGTSGMSSLWDQITNFFTPSPASAATSGVQNAGQVFGDSAEFFPGTGSPMTMSQGGSMLGNLDWIKAATSIFDLIQGKSTSNKLEDIARQAAERSDPFGSQRGLYQGLLAQSYLDPNFLMNNPAFQAMLNPALRQTNANLARRGLTNSGNALHEIMRTGTETAAKYMLPFQAQLAQNAGAGFSPTYSGFLQQQGQQLAAQGDNRANSQLFGTLAGIFGPTIQKSISNWLV